MKGKEKSKNNLKEIIFKQWKIVGKYHLLILSGITVGSILHGIKMPFYYKYKGYFRQYKIKLKIYYEA